MDVSKVGEVKNSPLQVSSKPAAPARREESDEKKTDLETSAVDKDTTSSKVKEPGKSEAIDLKA